MAGWRRQSAVTVVAAVKPEALPALRGLLQGMSGDVRANDVLPFGRLDDTHYARLFVLGSAKTTDGKELPAYLVFMSDVDGRSEEHLAQVVDVGGSGIDRLYSHCADYQAPASGRRSRLAYLLSHRAKSFKYVNTVGRTVRQIRQEAELREAIEGFLDQAGPRLADCTASEVRAAIRDFVASDDRLRWALTPAPKTPLAHRLRELAHFALPVVPALFLGPVLVPTLLVWVVVLRAHEVRDPAPLVRPDPAHLEALRALEDHTAQNQFTAAGLLKPGWFRKVTATTILWLVAFGARHIFNNGNLAGVKTIHFARWVLLDGGARSVFASNYDGSTESYMDDFIDKVAWGLNAVFSNGAGYPHTRWLLFGGAREDHAFNGNLRAASFMLLESTDAAATRAWLALSIGAVTDARSKPTVRALNIAVTSK